MGGFNLTDVRWERIPLFWSTVRERVLAKHSHASLTQTVSSWFDFCFFPTMKKQNKKHVILFRVNTIHSVDRAIERVICPLSLLKTCSEWDNTNCMLCPFKSGAGQNWSVICSIFLETWSRSRMGQLSVLSLWNLEQDISIIIYVLLIENVEQVRIIISVIRSVF